MENLVWGHVNSALVWCGWAQVCRTPSCFPLFFLAMAVFPVLIQNLDFFLRNKVSLAGLKLMVIFLFQLAQD